MSPQRRRRLLLGALLLVGALVPLFLDDGAVRQLPGGDAAAAALRRARLRAPTVVFVVLDTVRADHVSACGYGVPTTPVLTRLVDAGASLACRAVAPGDWTLPSHASYFTGRTPLEHGARFGGGADISGVGLVPLDDRLPTLAERFAARGYGTLLVAANPMLQPAGGLARGYEEVEVAGGFNLLTGAEVVERVDLRLANRPADGRPLFLTVNLLDAHQPWPGPRPDDVHRGPHTPLDLFQGAPMPWTLFTTVWTAAERAAFLPGVVANYDNGVHRADAALGHLLERLEARGWLGDGWRLVVTSDHGEFLGEHGLLDHGRYLYEVNQRVPVLFFEEGRSVVLPEDPPALVVHDLVLEGVLPALGPPVVATWPDSFWSRHSGGRFGVHTSVARWEGARKEGWRDGTWTVVDLATDGAEQAPVVVGAADVSAPLRDAVTAAVRLGAEAVDVDLPAELREALRAAGYLE